MSDAQNAGQAPDRAWVTQHEEIIADYGIFRVRRITARGRRAQKTFDFHTIDRPNAVQIIAITDDNCIILVEQFRHGAHCVTLEFPAGNIDDGEDPAGGALRELEEETGYRARRHEIIGEVLADAALHSSHITIVAVYGCTPGGTTHADESEDLRIRLVPRAQIDDLIASGELRNAPTLAAWHVYTSRR